MANIRKTFNFRNGVQVDDDNLIVNPTGLVGIGTSVPTELLDVRGTAKIVGLVTANEVFTGNIRATGVSTFSGGLRVGIVSVGQNGIITATSASGVVTYYGDGGRLLNLPTSQWLDVDIGLGFTSIYAQGFVGVNTTSPFYPFQVGGTDSTRVFESVGARGVGIDSTGNIYSTGIVTAREYKGIGIALTDLNASNISYGTLDNARLPQNISISGILTATSVVSTNVNINSGGVNVIGVVTATGGFVGNVTGNVVGNVTGTATTATSLSGTPNIVVGIVTATELISNISSTGISTVVNRLYVGNSIGLNTISPSADVHVYKSGNGGILLTSTQESYVGVARSLTRGQQGGEIRFANLSGAFSGQTSLDLVNYDNGSINQYIHQGAAGINTGNFNWVYGQNQTGRMTLTWDGKLGIAKTNPDHQLHVVGTSTITDDLYIGDDLFVRGDSTLSGDLAVVGNFTTNNLSVLGGISANLNNTSGVSTFYDINVTNIGKLNKVAIGTDDSIFSVQIGTNSDLSNGTGIVASSNFVGLGSTAIYPQIEINAIGQRAILRAVGIGTTRPKAAVDFSEAGTGYFSDAYRFMLLPRLTTTQRNNLDTTTDNIRGAVVFNTTTLVPEYYTGSTWVQMAQSGTISYAERSGIATYANSAGFSTDAANVIGGIVSCSQLNVYNSGISTFSGITTVTGPTFFAKQINVSGVVTASQFIRQGGTSSQFLKADGSIDSSTYLTSYTETSTLANVTSRGNLTTNGISVGVVTATRLEVGTGVTVSAGIVTATNGFSSGIGTAVQITTVGSTVVFAVPGVGTTSLTLF
jgi:hypothetical protein